jgi:hypothetical protein
VVYAIDPLLAALAHFDTSQDLSDRIQTLFKVLDVDENGGMSYQELKVGLTQLKISPPIVINRDDWDSMTCNDTLTSADGSLTLEAFDAVMRSQLKLYVQRQMANSIQMNSSDGPNQMGTLLFVMKLLMISVDDIQQNLAGRTNSAHPCAAAGRESRDGRAVGQVGGGGLGYQGCLPFFSLSFCSLSSSSPLTDTLPLTRCMRCACCSPPRIAAHTRARAHTHTHLSMSIQLHTAYTHGLCALGPPDHCGGWAWVSTCLRVEQGDVKAILNVCVCMCVYTCLRVEQGDVRAILHVLTGSGLSKVQMGGRRKRRRERRERRVSRE